MLDRTVRWSLKFCVFLRHRANVPLTGTKNSLIIRRGKGTLKGQPVVRLEIELRQGDLLPETNLASTS